MSDYFTPAEILYGHDGEPLTLQQIQGRWAAFTETELAGMRYALEVAIIGGIGEVDLRQMVTEIASEIERRT